MAGDLTRHRVGLRWEAEFNAQQTLAAARKGLEEAGAELDEPTRDRIADAIASTDAALATESSTAETGDLNRLKAAIQELDAATQPLADLLLDCAMEAVLQKRGIVK